MEPETVVVVEPRSLEPGAVGRSLRSLGWRGNVVRCPDGLAALEYAFATGRFHEGAIEPAGLLIAADAAILGGLEVARRLRASTRLRHVTIGLLVEGEMATLEPAGACLGVSILTTPLDVGQLGTFLSRLGTEDPVAGRP